MIKLRAQLSIEFLVYLSLSVVALSFILMIYDKSIAYIDYYKNSYDIRDLIELFNSLNPNIDHEYSYVPSIVCKVKINSNYLSYGNVIYKVNKYVVLSKSICENSGNFENLNITLSDGKYYIR